MKKEFFVGETVKGYRIVEKLGNGAMGIVYKAIQINLERPVALKMLLIAGDNEDDQVKNKEFINRFFNEVKLVAKLAHPNIIQAYDAGTDNARFFYAMEYIDGKNLKTYINEKRKIEVEEALKIASELASALNYGWGKHNIIHGDIKPENIMIDIHDRTKLMDFGLASVKKQQNSGDNEEKASLIFTPLYAAPELILSTEGNASTLSSDIYAFGCTLYHMLYGEPPFPGYDSEMVMKAHIKGKHIPLIKRMPSFPETLSKLIDSMLIKNPKKRINDWGVICSDLEKSLVEYHQIKEQERIEREPKKKKNVKILKSSHLHNHKIKPHDLIKEKKYLKHKSVIDFIFILLLLAIIAGFSYVLYLKYFGGYSTTEADLLQIEEKSSFKTEFIWDK